MLFSYPSWDVSCNPGYFEFFSRFLHWHPLSAAFVRWSSTYGLVSGTSSSKTALGNFDLECCCVLILATGGILYPLQICGVEHGGSCSRSKFWMDYIWIMDSSHCLVRLVARLVRCCCPSKSIPGDMITRKSRTVLRLAGVYDCQKLIWAWLMIMDLRLVAPSENNFISINRENTRDNFYRCYSNHHPVGIDLVHVLSTQLIADMLPCS